MVFLSMLQVRARVCVRADWTAVIVTHVATGAVSSPQSETVHRGNPPCEIVPSRYYHK